MTGVADQTLIGYWFGPRICYFCGTNATGGTVIPRFWKQDREWAFLGSWFICYVCHACTKTPKCGDCGRRLPKDQMYLDTLEYATSIYRCTDMESCRQEMDDQTEMSRLTGYCLKYKSINEIDQQFPLRQPCSPWSTRNDLGQCLCLAAFVLVTAIPFSIIKWMYFNK